jgi:hypothetical protein
MDKKTETKALPRHLLEWLAASRIKFLNDIRDGKPLRYFAAHLPVVSTWTKGGAESFPVNMTVKGIGLIPRMEIIERWRDTFEGVLAQGKGLPWEESLARRVDAINALYGDIDNFDPTLMGGLEIFEGTAFRNLSENPCASLLYTGMEHGREGMKYISFQVNGTVEILGKKNPCYAYLLAARRLFEFDKFHLFQPDYPYGYLINVVEAKDKSPWSRPAHGAGHAHGGGHAHGSGVKPHP